jgi:hypothetical protein
MDFFTIKKREEKTLFEKVLEHLSHRGCRSTAMKTPIPFIIAEKVFSAPMMGTAMPFFKLLSESLVKPIALRICFTANDKPST